jgi:hypothetical protein
MVSTRRKPYVGAMNTIGLDIGITAGGAMAWGVFAPTAGPELGALARNAATTDAVPLSAPAP